ncbi:sensor histidine kinase [Pedobacter sp. AW31-3R]|uniref:sensor histidine kinase n=1 Tax=Pedobacter sp. AW31-3R TaxID=3445781 RepID=UPI003FA02867
MMQYKKILFLLFAFVFHYCSAYSGDQDGILNFRNGNEILRIDHDIFIFKDPSRTLGINEVIHKNFVRIDQEVPNLGITADRIWVKFTIRNQSPEENLLLVIAQPAIDSITLYRSFQHQIFHSANLGKYRPFHERIVDNPNYVFPVSIPKNTEETFYISINSTDQIQLPISIGTQRSVLENDNNRNILFGIYAGVILIMILYNLFISFTVKDSSYLYYIIYIFFVGLTQATFQGYAFKFLWPDSPWLAINSSMLVPFFSGISTAEFLKRFLQTKRSTPALHRGINMFIILYIVVLVLWMSGFHAISIQCLQILAMFGSLYFLYVANAIRQQGSRPALFFLVAYTIFMFCVVIFVLRNFNIVTYNLFTSYILEIGSVIQITLLSFALADKINIFRKENEQAQEQALRVSKENERLIREQNIELEIQVNKRTEELQNSNSTLNHTLTELKEAQSQLVDAEKMASLGQLTAGIAHEINNPINFVTSNIKPLELDINDLYDVIQKYEDLDPGKDINAQLAEVEAFKKSIDVDFIKTEINSLLSGIGEGAKRTAEIIRSLKNFSRLDESDTKPVDLNEGLDSTLILLRSQVPPNVTIVKNFQTLPLVECLPGKINQIFMNLITNGIHAIRLKGKPEQKEELAISTWQEGEYVKISIKDSGIGMSEEIRQKIFEPFFTTKQVGEGTGLGLSIVFSIIEKHRGQIDVFTKVDFGTEFIITLPLNIN